MSRATIFLYAVLCVLMVFVISVINENAIVLPEEIPAETVSEYITEYMPVKVEQYFEGCHHLRSDIREADRRFADKSFDELSLEGWYVFHGEGGIVCAYSEEEGLCPEDNEKYHFRKYDEGLVIIHGPVGYDGAVEGRIKIDIAKLPQLWQQMLEHGGVEFANREELIIALESLDEL